MIFISNGLHLVLSISATIGSKRNCVWVVALLLGLVEDRNRRNTVLRTFRILFHGLRLLQAESTFIRSLYEKLPQHCRTQRESSGAFWGFSGLLIPSRRSAPLVILKVRDLGALIPKTGNEYVI